MKYLIVYYGRCILVAKETALDVRTTDVSNVVVRSIVVVVIMNASRAIIVMSKACLQYRPPTVLIPHWQRNSG